MHEWEGQFNEVCDWCGNNQVRVLNKSTPMEEWAKDFIESQKSTTLESEYYENRMGYIK